MERLIDITLFFIIKVPQFDELITTLGLNLDKSSDIYLSTLILTNIFAYLVIYLFIMLLLKILKKLFRKRRYFSNRRY